MQLLQFRKHKHFFLGLQRPSDRSHHHPERGAEQLAERFPILFRRLEKVGATSRRGIGRTLRRHPHLGNHLQH